MILSSSIAAGCLLSHTQGETLDRSESWSRVSFAGRLCELSGHRNSAVLSLAFGLVLDAQLHNEPTSWITSRKNSFFPPDAAATGIDLNALVVIRLKADMERISSHRSYASCAARAAERLARSGAFGLIVLDLETECTLSMAIQARLAGLAKVHDIAIFCLTRKRADRPSIGSLVSWRANAGTIRVGPDRFECTAEVSKDKRRGPGWSHAEVHRGPPGLY